MLVFDNCTQLEWHPRCVKRQLQDDGMGQRIDIQIPQLGKEKVLHKSVRKLPLEFTECNIGLTAREQDVKLRVARQGSEHE